ncbi:MAG: hypothetical protein WCG04_03545 [Alphaproteobacteria bacterium]
MKCFNHKSEDAVGLCKHCGKAICQDCLCIVSDAGISCKNTCEEKVKLVDAYMHQHIYSRCRPLSMFYLVFGFLFMALGAWFYQSFSEVFAGLIFGGFGIAAVVHGLVIMKRRKNT